MQPPPAPPSQVGGGRPVLQLPGPTDVPDPVLRAIAAPTIDHRGAEFGDLVSTLLPRLAAMFGSTAPVALFPSSGTGAWEAAMVNTCSPGQRVVAFDSGYFARLWADLAGRLGLTVDLIPCDWTRGADLTALHRLLAHDRAGELAAVLLVHNETATGVTNPVSAVREVLDRTGHPALLLVDAVSSAPCLPYEHDRWRVDVTICGSQKGLMLPPGLGLNVVGEQARERAAEGGSPRGYWDWEAVFAANASGRYPYTPAVNLFFGLRTALGLLESEGLPAIHHRHAVLGRATRAAVRAWGLATYGADPTRHSDTVTAVRTPPGVADAVCTAALRLGNLTLGRGLGPAAGSVFRIGHLGQCGPTQLLGALATTELALRSCGLPARDGAAAALDVFAEAALPASAVAGRR